MVTPRAFEQMAGENFEQSVAGYFEPPPRTPRKRPSAQAHANPTGQAFGQHAARLGPARRYTGDTGPPAWHAGLHGGAGHKGRDPDRHPRAGAGFGAAEATGLS